MTTVDWDKEETKDFEPLEKGEYKVRVDNVETKESKEGNEYLNWTFKVIEGDKEGRLVFHNTSLLPNALWKLKELLAALGEKVEGKTDYDLDALRGRKLFASIGHRNYDGKVYNDVLAVKHCDDAPDDVPNIEEAAPVDKTEKPF